MVANPEMIAAFLADVREFVEKNCRGEVRILALIDTSEFQFFSNGMVDSRVWEHGMLKMAGDIMTAAVHQQVVTSAKAVADMRLAATEIKGPKQ